MTPVKADLPLRNAPKVTPRAPVRRWRQPKTSDTNPYRTPDDETVKPAAAGAEHAAGASN